MVKIEITPESIGEYEKRKGYPVEVIGTEDSNKGIIVEFCRGSYTLPFNDDEEIKRLVDNDFEALVNANAFERTKVEPNRKCYIINYYGLPVRKKK